MLDSADAIPTNIGETAENVDNTSADFPVDFRFKDLFHKFSHTRFLDWLQVPVIDGQVSQSNQQRSQLFQLDYRFWWNDMLHICKNRVYHMRVLNKKKRSLCVDTVKKKSVNGKSDFFFQSWLETQYHSFYLRHWRIHFCPFDIVHHLIGVTLFIIIAEFGFQGSWIHHSVPIFVEIVDGTLIHSSHTRHRFSCSTSYKFWEISVITLSKMILLFVPKKIFLVMVLQCETSWGACRRKTKLIYNFFPHFVMGDSLSSSLFAHRFVELVEIKFFSSDLRDFYLWDSLRCPILLQMLFES